MLRYTEPKVTHQASELKRDFNLGLPHQCVTPVFMHYAMVANFAFTS